LEKLRNGKQNKGLTNDEEVRVEVDWLFVGIKSFWEYEHLHAMDEDCKAALFISKKYTNGKGRGFY
jgi:hypothetical protein